jgi:intein/homing endonuclease
MKKIIFAFLLLFYSTIGFAQNSDIGNWLIYFGNKKIDSKWNWHHEVQYRNYNVAGDLEQLLLRTGIGFNITENNNNLLLGYGYIHSQNYTGNSDEKLNVNEHRVFQQFITRQSFFRVKLQHRYRFEQRWIEATDFRLRFRYFLAFNIAINNSDIVDNTWYGSVYNEIFINDDQVIFDRNRLYFGVGYNFNSTAKFELGYMNQFLNNGKRDQINIITFINF